MSCINGNNVTTERREDMKTLYIDLDGTCFEFKKDASLDEILERGFFSSLYPFDNVIRGIKTFHKENPDVKLKILSSCLDRDYILEEKNQLVDKYLPFIDKKDRIYVPYGKQKSHYMNSSDNSHESYLLDDYTKNLEDVALHNMTGIKLVNNINFTKGTWKGHTVHYELPDWIFASELKRIIKEESR